MSAGAPTLLTDLASVKTWLGITTTGSDAQLTALIAAVSGSIRLYCNRNFGTATYTETYDGSGTGRQWMNQRPVTAVSSITLNGVAMTQRPSNNVGGYGWTFNRNELLFAGGVFGAGFQNLTVAYTAGLTYSQTNYPDLWQAAVEWVGIIYRAATRIGKLSEGLANNTTAFLVNDIPFEVKTVLDGYKQVSPVQSLEM